MILRLRISRYSCFLVLMGRDWKIWETNHIIQWKFNNQTFQFQVGCDYSDQLIKICSDRQFNCFVSDCMKIPCKNENFDYIICIAVLHHLSTRVNRKSSFGKRFLRNLNSCFKGKANRSNQRNVPSFENWWTSLDNSLGQRTKVQRKRVVLYFS